MATNTLFTHQNMSSLFAASTCATSISSTSANKNPAHDSCHLLDLINKILNFSLALEGLHSTHSRHLLDAAVKYLGVMAELLELVADQGCQRVVNISQVTHLPKVYNKFEATENKRNRNDPMRSIRDSAIYRLSIDQQVQYQGNSK